MLDAIFSAMLSSGALQWLGAFLWGMASVILSPCGIAAIPLVVGYIANAEEPGRWEAFRISCAFCVGIVLNLLLVALVTSGVGVLLGGHERLLTFVTAAVFILMGLHLMGIVHIRLFSFSGGADKAGGTDRRGLRGALTLGIVSGLAIGPCSIGYISPLLSVALSQASTKPAAAVGLIVAYALGYSAVLILSGTFAQLASRWLQSERGTVILRGLNVTCGLALIAAGLYLSREMLLLIS